ncbi:hypothetical protein XM25_15235 [Devosia sp. H5989]|nr:hypothetical protein XM25_15235 [Devosia sp. H5989]
MREHLEGLLSRARTDKRREELEAELAVPPFPLALTYLWQAYGRLRRRCSTGLGLSPITLGEIDAFVRLTGSRLAPWEVETIERLDEAWLEANAKSA